MPHINPEKLLKSKWTAVYPKRKELHFMVTKLLRDEDEVVTHIELEAVINHKVYTLPWQDLKDESQWIMGWK